MAVADEPPEPAGLPDTQHDDDDWDEQRENFTLYYKTQNNTLKKSTELMIQNHDFHATQRQWERKINHWGLQKYMSRQSRIEAIESTGRTLTEVAESGRRQPGYLQPNDDRNIRRFARRELGRSQSRPRSRSRSQSFGNRTRSVTPNVGRGRKPSAPDEVVQRESTYNLDVSVLRDGNLPPVSDAIAVAIPALPTTQNSQFPQAHVMQTQNITTGETSQDLYISMPNTSLASASSQMDTGLAGAQYNGYGDMSQYIPDDMMAAVVMPNQTIPFPPIDLDTNIAPEFMSSQPDPMSATSPSFMQALSSPWNPSSFNGPPYGTATDFVHSIENSNISDFQQVPPEELSNTRSIESSIGVQQESNMENVPNIVVFPQPSPTFESSVPTFPPTHMAPNMYKDQTIYGDFYASIGGYTNRMENTIMQFVHAHGADEPAVKQLWNELHAQRAALVGDLTMHLNSLTSTNQRTVQAMRNDLYILRLRLRGGDQPETTPMPGHAHRFSSPDINSHFPYSSGVPMNFNSS